MQPCYFVSGSSIDGIVGLGLDLICCEWLTAQSRLSQVK